MALTPTVIDVSTEAQLDAAIAEVNAAAAGSFEIVLQADIAETYVAVNAVNLPSGVTLSISDDTNTLAGPYALAPAITIASGSTLTTVGAVPTGEMITFAGTGARSTELAISAPSQFAGTVEGLASGDELAVNATITAATTGPGSYNSTTNSTSLVLKDGTTTVATLSLEGDYGAATFSVSSDNVTVNLPSAATTLPSGSTLTGTEQVSAGATTTQTGQITFGSGSDPATVINQGTYDITGAWGISVGNANSLLINDGTMERAANGVDGNSYINVDVIDTGTISVPNNTPSGNTTDLVFGGADNSISGTFIGSGMIDYGNESGGSTTEYLGNIDMSENACTTALYKSTIYQSGVVELSSFGAGNQGTLAISPDATWNFTSNNGIAYENLSEIAQQTVYVDGTIAKTGGTGTTVIAVDVNANFGSVVVATGTLGIDGPNNVFTTNSLGTSISGPGTISLGVDPTIGTALDAINTGTTITTGGWTIAGAAVTLNEALTYAGVFTEQSGSTLTLNDSLTLSNATFDGTVTGSSTAEIIMASGATLSIEDLASKNFNAPIGGFASGEKIILQGFGEYPTINGTSPSYNSGTNTTT